MPSHGSLSKAGKVRDRNRKDWGQRKKSRKGLPRKHNKPHKNPRLAKRRKYLKTFIRTSVVRKKRRKWWR